MYHGVTDQPIPVWTQVQKDEFEAQMQYISENYHPISLPTAVEHLIEKKPLPPHSIAVTFDDGFKNNFTIAYPILKKYNIPATIFITTSLIKRTGDFEGFIWTDYIQSLLLETANEFVEFDGKRLSLTNQMDRIKAKKIISDYLKQSLSDEKYEYIQTLKKKLNVKNLCGRNNIFHGLSWDEIKQMDSENLITFGGHTVNHHILSRISSDDIEREIIDGKKSLAEQINKPVTLFAYPNGQPEDFNDVAVKIASENFDAACSTIEGLSGQDDDIYRLKRIPVGNDTKLWQFKMLTAGVNEKFRSLFHKD